MSTVLIQSCTAENVAADGTCTVPVWIAKPEQALPPLSLADGTQIAFAIVGAWTVGLLLRIYARASRSL